MDSLDSFPVLRAVNLCKSYQKNQVVNNFNLQLFAGQCIGLLGPNGAGKSTTLEMLEGVIKPDSGEIFFKGQPLTSTYQQHIGIQFQQTALPDYLTVRECLMLFASFYPQTLTIEVLIELCELQDFIDQLHFYLSGGQRQRLLLAMSLINNPCLLFLDEPTTGLDPAARQAFWRTLARIKSQGTTILITTHYMEEAEVLCDQILMMSKGEIIAQGEPQHLLTQHFAASLAQYNYLEPLPDPLIKTLRAQPSATGWLLASDNAETIIQQLLAHQLPLTGLHVRAPSLEDLFLKVTTTVEKCPS